MGQPVPQTTQESMAQVLQAYSTYLPKVAQAAIGQIGPTEQAKLASSQAVSPGYSQLQADLFKQFGPQLAETGNQINAQNAQASAASDLSVLQGPGRDLVTSADALSRELNPGFYTARDEVGGGISKLLGGMDPNKLTSAELENQSRGLSRIGATSAAGNPSMTSALANAGTFGDALSKKRSDYMGALQTATGGIGALAPTSDVLQTAVGRSSAMNTGADKFMGAKENTGQDAFSMAGNFMNTVAGTNQQANDLYQNRTTGADRALSAVSSY